MSEVIRIEPDLTGAQAELVLKNSVQLDRLLEGREGGPLPVAGHGLLEQMGDLLWQASGLEAEPLIAALDKARANETPLRLEVCGTEHQQLPW